MTHPVNCIITNADTTATDNTALGEEDALRCARAWGVWEHTNQTYRNLGAISAAREPVVFARQSVFTQGRPCMKYFKNT